MSGSHLSGSQWRKVKGVDRSDLREARLQAHYAVQWLARAARAYATPAPDDRHTNLGWDDAIVGLTTHALPQGTVLGLNISELTLIWRYGRRMAESQAISLEGRCDAEIRQWLGRRLIKCPSIRSDAAHPMGRPGWPRRWPSLWPGMRTPITLWARRGGGSSRVASMLRRSVAGRIISISTA
jgi:hypothetical protein